MFARFGGEEFALVWFGCDDEEISGYADQLRMNVQDAFVLSDGSKINRTASIGVAFFNDKDIRKKGFNDALKLADKACLEAKKEGRNRVVLVTDKAVNKWEREGFFLEVEDIEKGVIEKEFYYHSDVIVNSYGSEFRPEGVEALVRWAHPKLGELVPHHFLEKFDEATREKNVWHGLCEAKRAFLAANSDSDYFIFNLSASYLEANLSSVIEHFRKLGVKTEVIYIEIQDDRDGRSDLDQFYDAISALKSAGFKVSLNQIAEKTSLIKHVMKADVDMFKLNISLLKHNEGGLNVKNIRALVALASQLDIKMVVTHVSEKWEANELKLLGVTHLQGWYFNQLFQTRNSNDERIYNNISNV